MTHVRVAVCRSWRVLVAIHLSALAETRNVSPVMTITNTLTQMVGNVGSWTSSYVGDASF